MTDRPAFSVCSMMRERPDVIGAFLDHYQALGAEEILIYLDMDECDTTALARDGVTFILCDEAFWSSRGGRPVSFEGSQTIVFTDAHARRRTDWLLIVDADELLVSEEPVASWLPSVPTEAGCVRIANTEGVWGPGDDVDRSFGGRYLRRALPHRIAKPASKLLYGRFADFFECGLIGHSSGKQLLHRDAVFDEIRCHEIFRGGRPVGVWLHEVVPACTRDRVNIAHFDAIDYDRWVEKWRRRYSGEVGPLRIGGGRLRQQNALKALTAGDPEAARTLFRGLYSLNAWQVLVLRAIGRLYRRPAT